MNELNEINHELIDISNNFVIINLSDNNENIILKSKDLIVRDIKNDYIYLSFINDNELDSFVNLEKIILKVIENYQELFSNHKKIVFNSFIKEQNDKLFLKLKKKNTDKKIKIFDQNDNEYIKLVKEDYNEELLNWNISLIFELLCIELDLNDNAIFIDLRIREIKKKDKIIELSEYSFKNSDEEFSNSNEDLSSSDESQEIDEILDDDKSSENSISLDSNTSTYSSEESIDFESNKSSKKLFKSKINFVKNLLSDNESSDERLFN